jgi:hypothetical protein
MQTVECRSARGVPAEFRLRIKQKTAGSQDTRSPWMGSSQSRTIFATRPPVSSGCTANLKWCCPVSGSQPFAGSADCSGSANLSRPYAWRPIFPPMLHWAPSETSLLVNLPRQGAASGRPLSAHVFTEVALGMPLRPRIGSVTQPAAAGHPIFSPRLQ